MLDITVCVYDSGSFTPLALALVDKVKKVYYFSVWEKDGFPEMKDDNVGTGIKGVTRLSNPFSKIGEIDLWIFPDVYYQDIQLLLKSLGKLVWGSGISAWMELNRFALREWEASQDMPASDAEVYDGIEDIIKNLPKDHYIKFSKYRGNSETFKYYDKQRSEYRAKEIELHLGILSKEIEVMGEAKIDGFEIGTDTYSVDGQMPSNMMWGIEIKDAGYLGKISTPLDLPRQLKYINGKLKPIFQEEKMRSHFSYEMRTENPVKGFLTDMTQRMPNPPYQAHLNMVDNLAEIMYYGAQGILVQPKYNAKYCAIAIMTSDFAVNNIMPIKVPKKNRDNVYIMGLMIRDDEYYSITNRHWDGEFGAVVGTGNTKDEAIKNCIKNADGIEGDSLTINLDALQDGDKQLREMRGKIGVMF